MNLTNLSIKALFAATLCAGLAACGTTDTTTDSSGTSTMSATGAGTQQRDPAVWNDTGNAPSTATPGTSPSTPSNADDNSVKR